MKKYLVEFIGTFFLVLVVGLTVVPPAAGASAPNADHMAPLAIGFILMVMVYAGGHVSGGHYNPAVTLAVWIRGKCEAKDVLPYMASQIAGGVIAALAVGFFKGHPVLEPMVPDGARALLAEFLFTFALAYVVLSVATSQKIAGNSFYGLAIGGTVVAAAYAAGGISGGAFNPAVAIGISVMGLSAFTNIWIFLIANFAGGTFAAIVYKAVNADEDEIAKR